MKAKLYLSLSLLCALFILTPWLPLQQSQDVLSRAFAAPLSSSERLSSTHAAEESSPKAVLVNLETGQRIELRVEIQQHIVALGHRKTEYNVLVPTVILASNVNEKSKWDSSYSVYGTLRQYWSERFSGTNRYVAVSKYEARWVLYDYSVSMSNAKIAMYCFGEFWDGGMCNFGEVKGVGVPTSGVWYSRSPSWANRYVLVSCSWCYQEGRSQVTLKRGGSTWKLEICVDEGYGC